MTGYLSKPPPGVQIDGSNPLTNGLVGCWLFNEGAGLRANDLSGNGNHGVLTNFEPFSATSGWQGQGLAFDGSNDYVDLGNKASLNNVEQITLEAIINASNFTGTHCIYSDGHVGYPPTRRIDWEFSGNQLVFRFSRDGNEEVAVAFPGTFQLNTRYHVAVTYDNLNVTTYKNSLPTATPYTGNLYPKVRTAYIGARRAGVSFYSGTIEEFRIWNRALNASEIQQLYSQPYSMFKFMPQSNTWR